MNNLKRKLNNVKAFIKKFWQDTQKPIILGIVIAILSVVGITYFILNKNSNEFKIGETKNLTRTLDYLVQNEKGEYFLIKANANIKFKVATKEKEVKYKVLDERENEVKTKAIKKDAYYEIVAEKSYEAGNTYKLVLENATFVDKKLKNINTLGFTIVRPNANTQVLNDDVKKVNNKIITSIKGSGDNFILTSKREYKKGDILYYKNGIDIKAFKVDAITKKGKSYIITTVTPNLKEVFKRLDIYGEFTPKITDFMTNEEIKEYVTVALKDSGILDTLLPSVHASDLEKIKIIPQKEGSVKVIINLELAGQENSIIDLKKLKNHTVSLNFELELKLKAHCDLTFFKQDIGANIDIKIKSLAEVEPSKSLFGEFEGLVKKDDEKEAQKAKDLLKQMTADEAKKEAEIGEAKIPTPISGLTVDLGLDLLNELKLAFKMSGSAKTNINISFGYKNGYYWNSYISTSDKKFDALGKANARLGFQPKVEIGFIEVLEAGIEAPFGLYVDGQVSYTTSDKKIDGQMEFGTFLEVNLYGKFSIGNGELAKIDRNIYENKNALITLEGTTGKGKDLKIDRDISRQGLKLSNTYKTRFSDINAITFPSFLFYYPNGWIVSQEKVTPATEIVSIGNGRGVEIKYAYFGFPKGFNFGLSTTSMERVDISKISSSNFVPGYVQATDYSSLGAFMIAKLKTTGRLNMQTDKDFSEIDGSVAYAVLPESWIGIKEDIRGPFEGEFSFFYGGYVSLTCESPDGKFTEKEELEVKAILESFRVK